MQPCAINSVFLPSPPSAFQNALWRHSSPLSPTLSSTPSLHSASICQELQTLSLGPKAASLWASPLTQNLALWSLFPRGLCLRAQGESHLNGPLAVSPTLQFICASLLCARLWSYGGEGDADISLKELNLNGTEICSLNEFGLRIYQCPSTFQILRHTLSPRGRKQSLMS